MATVGYTPFFVGLGVLDLVGAAVLWTLVREPRAEAPAAEPSHAERAVIRNPILRGFNPDPSIVRVGDDYYVATSTFEWFPGVQIHHSRDLVHWRLLTRPLTRASQLDMRGDPDSCGVWAPCLTHADGLFYLIYTDVKRYGRTTVAGRRAPRCATSTITWSPARASTATGRIPSTSTAAGSIPRCSTTTTGGSIS